MERCINAIKELIKNQLDKHRVFFSGRKFTEYQKTYYWTNEQLSDYLDLVSFDGKDSALTVAASGDQTFNLITNGITTIDTFDSNKFTEYFALGFKRAMVLKYNYSDFCLVSEKLRDSKISLEELSEIVLGLLPFMELNHRIFWKEIVDYNYKLQIENETNLNLFLMLTLEKQMDVTMSRKFFNNYLKDEAHYNLLKERLAFVNISFTHCDAMNLANNFSSQYDFVLLSNILDYFGKQLGNGWGYPELRKYTDEIMPMLKSDGVLFLHYIFGVFKNGEIYRRQIINSSSIVPMDLMDESLIYLPKRDVIENAIILKRVNDK